MDYTLVNSHVPNEYVHLSNIIIDFTELMIAASLMKFLEINCSKKLHTVSKQTV
jgi:hypothetical protein